MRIALVSDLHGNLLALDTALEDARRAGVDQVICLGDIADLGPQPTQTIARLRELGIPCIQGNHDPFDHEMDLPLIAPMTTWVRAQLSSEDLAWLRALPTDLEVDLGHGRTLWCVHGSPASYDEGLLPWTPPERLDELLDGRRCDVLACGHTHVQVARRHDDVLVVNVGSTGAPFARPFSGAPPRLLPVAEYAIVESTADRLSVDLRQVPLDRDALRLMILGSGLPGAELWASSWG